MDAPELRAAVEAELHGNLLPFWRQRSVDRVRGGFIAEMAHDGTLREKAAKGLILNARLLWTFAALYRRLGDPADLQLAKWAIDYLERHFHDHEHGGYVWRVDPFGRPVDRVKKIYGQAFCLYALSELYLATGDAAALAAAKRTFELIERRARDPAHGGYIEALAADWSATTDLRLSDKDMNVAKSMNNHLHLLEAYTNLYRAWPVTVVAKRLRELVGLFDRHILERDADHRACHLHHFFDKRWQLCSDSYTYGHDLEAAWLLCEAAEVLGDAKLEARADRWAVDIAGTAIAEALDEEGGLAFEGRNGSVTDPSREWWCQAEAVVGLWSVFESSGEVAFAEAAARVWAFIERRMVDRIHGEWFWRVRADGSVDEEEPKVSEWKGPYHNTRMCLELMRRIDNSESRQRR